MVFENLWPLIFLLAVPVIFVLYLKKTEGKGPGIFFHTFLERNLQKY